MPTYRFTHVYDAIFPDLQHGVNADVKGADPVLAGSTVVLSPGDEITTQKKLRHAFLELLRSGGEDPSDKEPTNTDPDGEKEPDNQEPSQGDESTEPTE